MNSLIQTQKSGELAAALLSVYVERAEDLPVRPPLSPWLPGPPPPSLPRVWMLLVYLESQQILNVSLSQGGAGVGRIVCPRRVVADKW